MLVCNMLVSVGSVTLLASMARDQTKSVTCLARKIQAELAELAGETAYLN